MIKQINIYLLTMFGVGYSKFAPGTVASFITCFVYVIFFSFKINITILLIFFLIILFYSFYAIEKLKNYFDEKDSSAIVIDEFIGQSIPILTIYYVNFSSDLIIFVFLSILSFLLFRFFDILKPFPINYIDKNFKNSLGIILDDIIAGIFSIITLFFLHILLIYVF
jgi:phosphatidylglycerophosphatase A